MSQKYEVKLHITKVKSGTEYTRLKHELEGLWPWTPTAINYLTGEIHLSGVGKLDDAEKEEEFVDKLKEIIFTTYTEQSIEVVITMIHLELAPRKTYSYLKKDTLEIFENVDTKSIEESLLGDV